MTLFPTTRRRPLTEFGSATLFLSQRVGAGTTAVSEDVDITRHETKSFGVRGNVRGSWRIQVAFTGTANYHTLADGTVPASAGPGTVKTISFTEAFRRARLLVRLSSVGSVSGYYGGLSIRGR
jgi:hypothetical protein